MSPASSYANRAVRLRLSSAFRQGRTRNPAPPDTGTRCQGSQSGDDAPWQVSWANRGIGPALTSQGPTPQDVYINAQIRSRAVGERLPRWEGTSPTRGVADVARSSLKGTRTFFLLFWSQLR